MKILNFKDKKNYNFYFKKYWNSFVRTDTPKIHFSFDEFIDKMNDEYIRVALEKMEYQERLVSCQYIKESEKRHGFANFFLMRLPKKNTLCCDSQFYFIYKKKLKEIKKIKKEIFLPRRNIYNKFEINPDSMDYLANFAIPLEKEDYIYCLGCQKIIEYKDIFDNKIINLRS